MSLKFYYAPMTSATRVHWALEELGVPYEKHRVDLSKGEQRSPEFLALNPNGKVPVLVDGDVTLFESLAILLHLGEAYGAERDLFPAPGPARAEAFKWMCWGGVSLLEPFGRYLRNVSERFPAEERNEKSKEAASREVGAMLALLDRALEGREYLASASFSLVDLSLAAYMPFMARNGVALDPHKNVQGWLARCTARPALARAMQG